MHAPIKNVVILGGGSAGWMSAAYLAKALEGTSRVTLIESPAIPKIGVGEATIPNLQRVFFDFLGLREDDWMRECNASIKAAIKFVNWRAPRTNGVDNYFYHTFGLLQTCDGMPLSHYWVKHRHEGNALQYDTTCLLEPPLLDAKRSPRGLDGSRATNYAWHFDANLVAEFLKRHSVRTLGVQHILDEYEHATLDENGFITSLTMKSGRVVEGDLFVDCTGFRSLLMNGVMGEPFVDMGDHLLCDSAVAAAVPHDDARFGVEPYTSAIAMDSGWTWKIPMLGRFGSGYVFSSQFATMDQAAADFCALWGIDEKRVPLNRIRFRVGHNRRSWVKNCVGIGLSSCFLEPLESTGLFFIYAAVYQLVKHFPDHEFNPTLADRFNREIESMFNDCRDFVQAHYVVSPREDTPFWRANKTDVVLSDNFRDKLETYKSGLAVNMVGVSPSKYYSDFELEFRTFWTNHSYYCIFAGLDCVPQQVPLLTHRPSSCRKADRMFARLKRKQQELVRTLPTMHEFLMHLHHGPAAAERAAVEPVASVAELPPLVVG